MKNLLFLIPFFLFACKKNDDRIPLATINQYPSAITIYNIDTGTNAETLQFNINYFYNDSNRLDSVRILNTTYRFDYAQFASNSKIKLNYGNAGLPYDIIAYDNVYYTLTTYKQIFGTNDTAKNLFQYDSISRLKRFEYSYNNSLDDFIITQTYKRDTVFVHTELPFGACTSADTMINSIVQLSKTLPYLLFTKPFNSCTTVIIPNMLSALPLSSFINQLPAKMISNNHETNYTYTYDSNLRLTEALVFTKLRSNNLIIKKVKIVVIY